MPALRPAQLTIARLALAAAFALSATATVEASGPAAVVPTFAATASAHTVFLPLLIGGAGAAVADQPQIYWGAMVDGKAPTTENLAAGGVFAEFEANTNKGMSILHWGQPWEMHGAMAPFQTSYFENVRNRGSIPMLDWGSWALGGGAIQPKYRLSQITAGVFDAYIADWAADAKAWGHPFFLRFNWEMNGNWQFPWSAQLNGNTAADFVASWQHVHDIFTAVGADNATWVWCPNVSGSTTLPYASLYPGDAYVDWTCLDGYNFYDTWISSNAVFNGAGINWLYNSYDDLLAVAPTKPIMIGETSSVEAGDGGAKKAAWITEMLSETLPNRMPAIKAVVWFNWDANAAAYATLPIESSAASLAAFETAINSSYYAANDYRTLSVSPIPAP